jgi:hypothetical protein
MCTRRGAFRLARLAEAYGKEIGCDDLLAKLTADCAGAAGNARHPFRRVCKAFYIDFEGPKRPPDLPPGAAPFRVIEGGNAVEAASVDPLLKRALR